MILPPLGATPRQGGSDFAVWSHHASLIELCLFDETGTQELKKIVLARGKDDVHRGFAEDVGAGARYGLRAHGIYAPSHGLWYDGAKLLVDPYAKILDRPFIYDSAFSAFGADTAHLVPKAIVTEDRRADPAPPLFDPSGLIYEVSVRALTMRHPDIPAADRGTLKALAHPAIIAHLKRIGVSAVELMPVTAWIDERHLGPLGLHNGWGYNPISMMALDPRLVPGGLAELRETVAAFHTHGIGIILDLVFNHTGESDIFGPTLSLRGLDNLAYYRHEAGDPGKPINDTGCGNTLATGHPIVHQLIIDTLRHFVLSAGVDGFRFDLAPVLGRNAKGFDPHAPLIRAIIEDPVLADRVMIVEPWDVGLGGYQLGNFPNPYFEWNDRARDDLRMFWRGDRGKVGILASVLAGSSDIFGKSGETSTRSVNFIAAHDGFTLLDLVSHAGKHNEANGEANRDGHNENHSWNNGAEGSTTDPAIIASRQADQRALLATLFVSRGAIMVTAGDEFGRTQRGNNNAYAQDNELTWLDWANADRALMDYVARLALVRARFSVFGELSFFTGRGDVSWLTDAGAVMQVSDWQQPLADHLTMVLATGDGNSKQTVPLAIAFNRALSSHQIRLPGQAEDWTPLLGTGLELPPRSVSIFLGTPGILAVMMKKDGA